MVHTLFAEIALLPEGWQKNILISIDDDGFITQVQSAEDINNRPLDIKMGGKACLPGMANVHSHSFQRAMAGLSETRAEGHSSFWSWRQRMYNLALTIGPEEFQAVATQLYSEMLLAGYTSVGEFHYLHHNLNGVQYEDPALLSKCLIKAAEDAGIALTLLPVFYENSDFGGLAPLAEQRRFIHSTDKYLELLSMLSSLAQAKENLVIGMAPHSLRALTPMSLKEIVTTFRANSPDGPIHIHVAEQMKEVETAVKHLGARPVEFLLSSGLLDKNWCLIHATHILKEERQALAASGATVGLCITTEANLGDGPFPLQPYLSEGGNIAIGSDSNVSISPTEEIRWMEYQARLMQQKRTVFTSENMPSNGRYLYEKCLSGGHQSLARKSGKIACGYKADLIFLDLNNPWLTEKNNDEIIDSWIFTNTQNTVTDVFVGGKSVVANGQHQQKEAIQKKYQQSLRGLRERF